VAKAASLSPNPATAGQTLVCQADGVAVVPTSLIGWSAAESTGSAAASFRLHDGTSAATPELTAAIKLVAGESDRDWFGDQTVEVFSGSIFVEIISGSVELVTYWG
jgi:hypothetical protein